MVTPSSPIRLVIQASLVAVEATEWYSASMEDQTTVLSAFCGLLERVKGAVKEANMMRLSAIDKARGGET